MLPQFLHTAESMYKMYIPIHIVPFLLFKRKKLMKKYSQTLCSPLPELFKLAKSYTKSVLFAASYTGLLSLFLCLFKNLAGDVNGVRVIPPAAFFSGVALMFENSTRRQEIALFLVPKVLEAFHLLAKRRGFNAKVPIGEALIFGLAMAIIGYFYQFGAEHIKPSYYSACKKVIGAV